MSTSLTDFERFLLEAIIGVSLALAAASILMVGVLAIRRAARDRLRCAQADRNEELTQALNIVLFQKIENASDILPRLKKEDASPLVDALLMLLRNLSGPVLKKLTQIIESWGAEDIACAQALSARRGGRIEAIAVLSYLSSEKSLAVISRNLESRDSYIQLAAMRAAARRNATHLIPGIIERLKRSDDQNGRLLAGILYRFGAEISPFLSELAMSAESATVRAAALTALTYVSAPTVSVDLEACMKSPDVNIRATAVTLAGATHMESDAPFLSAVSDQSALVRARAASAIRTAEKRTLMDKLVELYSDPVWWVRYRACQALLGLGAEGKAILRSLSRIGGAESVLATEVLAEAERP